MIIKHTYKWVVSGERYFNKYNPTGEPTEIPINNFNTKFKSILFQTYGIIKILIKTSNINTGSFYKYFYDSIYLE